MVYTPKTIYCPRCGRKVATHDGRSTMNISVECRKCHKKVVFYPENGKTKLKSLTIRSTSSGMTFIYNKSLQELVKGCYGRKILYTDVETITKDNIVKVVGDCIGNYYYNKTIIEYLWRYYKGDQPILYRLKVQNADITNKIVENHAYEIVQFKVGQTYGEPIQFISRKDDDEIKESYSKRVHSGRNVSGPSYH